MGEPSVESGMSDFDAWFAETVRCTVFPVDPEAGLPDWEAITGEAPESRDSKPRIASVSESGAWGETGGKLVLETNPGRAHLRISSELGVAAEGEGLGLPNVAAALADLRGRVEVWVPGLPPLMRVAFGATLLRPVSSRQEGYQLLDEYLPEVSVDPEHSQDFLYRINRRREVDMGEGDLTTVNRLSTWSVLAVQSLMLKVGEAAVQEIHTGSSGYHLRLELDISTTPEAAAQFPTDANQVAGVFDRMVALGAEIAEQGDKQ